MDYPSDVSVILDHVLHGRAVCTELWKAENAVIEFRFLAIDDRKCTLEARERICCPRCIGNKEAIRTEYRLSDALIRKVTDSIDHHLLQHVPIEFHTQRVRKAFAVWAESEAGFPGSGEERLHDGGRGVVYGLSPRLQLVENELRGIPCLPQECDLISVRARFEQETGNIPLSVLGAARVKLPAWIAVCIHSVTEVIEELRSNFTQELLHNRPVPDNIPHTASAGCKRVLFSIRAELQASDIIVGTPFFVIDHGIPAVIPPAEESEGLPVFTECQIEDFVIWETHDAVRDSEVSVRTLRKCTVRHI